MTEPDAPPAVAHVVTLWGQQPDVPDGDGDVFTADCLAAVPEPEDHAVITRDFRTDSPGGLWGSYGRLKRDGLPPGMALRPQFQAHDTRTRRDEHGNVCGLTYNRIEVTRWSLLPVDKATPTVQRVSA